MKKLTNYTPGLRGVTMKDGSVVWIKPGETVKIPDADDILATPDLGDKPKAERDEDDALIEAVEAARREVAESASKHIEAITREHGEALDAANRRAVDAEAALSKAQGAVSDTAAEIEALKATIVDQSSQIEALTKPVDPAPADKAKPAKG